MNAIIHATAIVDPDARLAERVEVGPYAVIGPGVAIGAGTSIGAHACLMGPMSIGEDCSIGPFVSLGLDPQAKGRRGATFGRTRIGARCVIREYAQVHRALHADGETVVGDDAYLMASAHVAHDCVLGRDVVLCNQALIAGHVHIGDRAFVSGNCVVHQFSRIGELSMVGGLTAVNRDVPPFGTVVGMRPPVLEGLNSVGLRRAGVTSAAHRELRRTFQILFRSSTPLDERLRALEAEELRSAEVARLVEFVRTSKRGVIGFGGGAGRERSELGTEEGDHVLFPSAPRANGQGAVPGAAAEPPSASRS